MGYAGVLPLTRDPTSSRVLDALLSSPTTSPKELRRFLLLLIGNYHTIADDRIGSRVVERCWSRADVFLQDKIAASLVEQGVFLQTSHYGHFFARKVELPLWIRAREAWKLKMAGLKHGFAEKPKKVKSEEGPIKKRREREVDEIDELFAQGSSKKIRSTVISNSAVEENFEDEFETEVAATLSNTLKATDAGLETILAALKGSV